MQRETELRLMKRMLTVLDEGRTDAAAGEYRHSTDAYHSESRHAKESEVLFRKHPVVLGLSLSIPKPGDYFTDDSTGTPIVVVRGKDGVVRAFFNVCRHRGTRLCTGSGHGVALVCPYHGWTYSLEGQLKGIPDQRSFPTVAPEEHGLVAMPTAERHGMIWVLPQAGEGPLDIAKYLGGLDEELAAYKIDTFRRWDTREVETKTNWKLVIDTFLEPYHFKVLHAQTVAKLFISNVCLFESFGKHLREVLPRHSIRAQKEVPESEQDLLRNTTIVYVLFPNTVFVYQLDHIEIWRVFPKNGRADEARMVLDFLIPQPAETEKARGHWTRSMDITVATVLAEDFPIAEGIQRGASSGALTHVVMGTNEPAIAHFERTVTETVESA